MKVELIKLQNELKLAQLIMKLLQEERNNQFSDQVNFHNLPNSIEEEMNQSELTTKENGREWKKVLSRKVSPNLLKITHLSSNNKQFPLW
jgi:vacuolar-type H+-ATPase subunit D/Vma8